MNPDTIALEQNEEMTEIKKINDELSETNAVLENAYLELVETLRLAVEAKDKYTRGHSDRVSAYSVLLGEKLGLSARRLKTLRIGESSMMLAKLVCLIAFC